MSEHSAVESIIKLKSWLNKNGYAGFDPYDVKAHPLLLKITEKSADSRTYTVLRELMFEWIYTFPRLARKLLGIKPEINAKAMGLFASSYLTLYQITKEEANLEKAGECIEWLIQNKVETGQGIGWGYPFDWQSTQLVPAFTPNGIVTTAAGDAFWKYYKQTNDSKYLEYCKQIAGFLNALPLDQTPKGICFSYTPLFKNHVHNLNLFVAEFLIRVGLETENRKWIDLGNSAVDYTITSQNTDGSFDYNGPPEKPQNFVDNYHTGFVLRMLHSIWKMTSRKDVFLALKKGYHHYRDNFFENGEVPKFLPDRKYRIDIHSSAESINCLSELSITFDDSLDLAERVLNWTTSHMQSKKGYFYYAILKSRFIFVPFTSKIPYIRWGQAWMLKAISNYLYHKDLTD